MPSPNSYRLTPQRASSTSTPLVKQADELPDNYWIEMSCIESFYGGELGAIKERLGAGRVLFGTGICFRYPEPAFVRMEGLDATEAEKAGIFGGNVLELLEGGD